MHKTSAKQHSTELNTELNLNFNLSAATHLSVDHLLRNTVQNITFQTPHTAPANNSEWMDALPRSAAMVDILHAGNLGTSRPHSAGRTQ